MSSAVGSVNVPPCHDRNSVWQLVAAHSPVGPTRHDSHHHDSWPQALDSLHRHCYHRLIEVDHRLVAK